MSKRQKVNWECNNFGQKSSMPGQKSSMLGQEESYTFSMINVKDCHAEEFVKVWEYISTFSNDVEFHRKVWEKLREIYHND